MNESEQQAFSLTYAVVYVLSLSVSNQNYVEQFAAVRKGVAQARVVVIRALKSAISELIRVCRKEPK